MFKKIITTRFTVKMKNLRHTQGTLRLSCDANDLYFSKRNTAYLKVN